MVRPWSYLISSETIRSSQALEENNDLKWQNRSSWLNAGQLLLDIVDKHLLHSRKQITKFKFWDVNCLFFKLFCRIQELSEVRLFRTLTCSPILLIPFSLSPVALSLSLYVIRYWLLQTIKNWNFFRYPLHNCGESIFCLPFWLLFS